MARLFTIFGKWMLVIAMIAAIDGHFIVMQSIAWTTMVLSNVRHENIGKALEQTFDGDHPCPICKGIEKARKSESNQQAPQVASTRLDLFYEARVITLVPAREGWELSFGNTSAQARPSEPILQPPRIAASLKALS